MRASSARLMNTPVRLVDLTFPQAHRLIHRTRLTFIDLDNLLSFAKRDRDGRIDSYLVAWLPDECLLLLFKNGEPANAVVLHTTGREVVTIGDAVRRMKADAERGEVAYCAAPLEQLAWMYQSCAEPMLVRSVDARHPGALFPALAREGADGMLELISNGRVSYLRFEAGRYSGGFFCDRLEEMPVPLYVESLFQEGPDGYAPALSAALFPPVAELPLQAPLSLVDTYRELFWRITDAVEFELPGEGKKRSQRVSAGIRGVRKTLDLLATPRGTPLPDTVVRPEELALALGDWTLQLLDGVEVVMPGMAPRVLQDATREHRYVLQAAGFYDRLPWRVAW